MDPFLDYLEIPLRLTLAAAVGGVLGFERERKGKPAGLRTHMMVALGSACFMIIGLELYSSAGDSQLIDPTRIVQGVAGGIGFLGAGVILRTRESVKGLTTASSIWMVGAIGAAAGGGQYALALTAAGIAFGVLHAMLKVERGWFGSEDDHPDPPASTERAEEGGVDTTPGGPRP